MNFCQWRLNNQNNPWFHASHSLKSYLSLIDENGSVFVNWRKFFMWDVSKLTLSIRWLELYDFHGSFHEIRTYSAEPRRLFHFSPEFSIISIFDLFRAYTWVFSCGSSCAFCYETRGVTIRRSFTSRSTIWLAYGKDARGVLIMFRMLLTYHNGYRSGRLCWRSNEIFDWERSALCCSSDIR